MDLFHDIMLSCKNGHFTPLNKTSPPLNNCPKCGEKLFKVQNPDNTGTLLDSQLQDSQLQGSQIPDNTGTLLDSQMQGSQTPDNTGTLLDSQIEGFQNPDNIRTQAESKLTDNKDSATTNLPNTLKQIIKGVTQVRPRFEQTLDFPSGLGTDITKNLATEMPTIARPILELKSGKDLETSPLEKPTVVKRKINAKAPAGYEIVGVLGRGAMGVVYKARQIGLKRLVALKMILSAGRASKLEIARFRIEAEAVAKLDHPNIVKIYEIGEIESLPFFSLEFVSGGVLSSRTKNNAPTARQAAAIMRGIAEGMDFAHRKGIVHRDLKPANILLSPPDQAGEEVDFDAMPLDLFVPKITDFGLAKSLEGDSVQTRDGAIMGTPSYMAPEQAEGKTSEIGPSADIYGLGAILYDLITGIPPFRGETLMDTITQVIHQEPVHPVRLNNKLPLDIATICLKCLEKDQKKRYATAGALAEDLRRYLVGEPILARPTPFYEFVWKWAKRKPAVAALILMAFFTTLGVSIGGYLLAGREKTRADENARLREVAVNERNLAEQQKLQAEKNFRDALAAVDQMLTKVGQNRLAHEPRMERVRRELLQQAKVFLSRFLDYNSDDIQVRWQTARSLMQLGGIEEMLGNFGEADKNLTQAIGQLNKLHELDAANQSFLADLADCKQAMALLLVQEGKPNLAKSEFQSAIVTRSKLESNKENLSKQAASEFNLGQLLRGKGKLEPALLALSATVKKLEDLVSQEKSNALQKQNLCKGYLGLAQTLQDLGRFEDCKSTLEKALIIANEIVAANPDNPEFRVDLASILNQKGKLLRDTDSSLAEESYLKALATQESLVADFPATPYYRQELANSLNNLGVLMQSSGQSKGAEKAFERSIGVREKLAKEVPWVPDYRKDFAAGLNNRGIQLQLQNRLKEAEPLYFKALEDLKSLVKEFPESIDYNLELARTYLNESVLFENLGKGVEAAKISALALEQLEKLALKNPTAIEVKQELARAMSTRAGLSEVSKLPQEKIELYESAANEFMKLALEFPEQTDYSFQQAQALINLGNYLKDINQSANAVKPWKQGRELLAKLVAKHPKTPLFSLELSRAQNEWAIYLVTNKQAEEAEKEFEQARVLQSNLVARFPEGEEYRLELIKTMGNLGMWALSRNLLEKAEPAFIKALELASTAKKTSPSLIQAQVIPTQSLADIYKQLAQNAAAEKYLKALVEIRRELVKLNLRSVQENEDLANSIESVAIYLGEKNRAPEAFIMMQESVSITKETGPNSETLRLRLLTLAEFANFSAKPEETLAAVQASLKIPSIKPMEMIKAVTLVSRAIPLIKKQTKLSEAERLKLSADCAKTAIEVLQKAVLAGLSDLDFLMKNPDLEPLRELPAFKELIKAVEMKKKP